MIGPRLRLAGLAALFAAPIAASLVTYFWLRPAPGSSYGELLLPPATITAQRFGAADGAPFEFARLAGKWIMVVSDSAACAPACRAKLATMRQVRTALGRNAGRVERVFVVDDARAPDAATLAGFEGTLVAVTPPGARVSAGAGNDREHIYLVDPHGNVMMRWRAEADPRRMLGDLQRLLKASQIG
jgi:cytochrome oxidase Cu insertion factor (SCO1/SenC/PrrC family)